ncbi:hypothetical protein HPP92_018334 [Vanilla planifolia]|uniref:Flavodoxin-like domain-containing protein n=1 Tax=Vanilla planifolia TaxID=51239 RepID=A0A835QBU3_VANPL|nr:hypothetical protein HPP92_018334 [Vanilla planifolia]
MPAATSIAVFVGCVLLLIWRRLGHRKFPPRLSRHGGAKREEAEAEIDDGRKKITIFFGTQTGTAEGFEVTEMESRLIMQLGSINGSVEGKRKDNWLENLTFAVFGLGNRQYEHFNKVVSVFVPVGLGDDDQCIEDDFNAWKRIFGQSWIGCFVTKMIWLVPPLIVAIPEYRTVFHSTAANSQPTEKSWNLAKW